MQDSNIESIIDELEAKGERLDSFKVEVKYQAFIGDYHRKGGGRTLHILIKCNNRVRTWQRFPITGAEPSEEMMSAYMKSAMADDLAEAADKTLMHAYLGTARNDIAANFIEFSEGVPLERGRIEKVLDRGQEVFEARMAEENIQDQETLQRIERLLAEYEGAYQAWKQIGGMRKQVAGQPIEKQVRAVQAIHETIPPEWIKEFLIDRQMTPSNMAYVHIARIYRHSTPEAAEKAIKRARRKKRDILEKRQMSPKPGRKK
jgi:hypothetical protein